MVIAMLSYSRSHHHNLLQKAFAVYFKFRGLSAKAFDALHALGITMSHKWTANAVDRISEKAMSEVIIMLALYQWLISYDNLNIPFRVFSQRLDNNGEFGNGCAATVYIKRNAVPPIPTSKSILTGYSSTRNAPIPSLSLDIYELAIRDTTMLHDQMTHRVLRFLLEHPAFDLPSYSGKNHAALQSPA